VQELLYMSLWRDVRAGAQAGVSSGGAKAVDFIAGPPTAGLWAYVSGAEVRSALDALAKNCAAAGACLRRLSRGKLRSACRAPLIGSVYRAPRP
jgi:hypothetical protein